MGRNPGIYRSWSKCHEQTNGLPSECKTGFLAMQKCVPFLLGDDNFTDKDQIKIFNGYKLIPIRQYVESRIFGRNSE